MTYKPNTYIRRTEGQKGQDDLSIELTRCDCTGNLGILSLLYPCPLGSRVAAWAMVRGGAPTPHVSLTSVSTRAGNAHLEKKLVSGFYKW